MIDKTRPHAAGKNKQSTRLTILTSFIPVPRRTARHDGWTAERQRGFIAALADLGSVRAAAHAVNMTPEGAYLLRRHPEARDFRKAWETALKLGVQRLEDIAMDRALNGVEVPVFCYGKLIGTRRVYNDALLMFLLRNRAPRRFAADSWQSGSDAATQSKLARLRREWIAEHEEERRRNAPGPEAIRASIDRKVADMKALVLAERERQPPHVREAYATYERLLGDWQAEQAGAPPALPAPKAREKEDEA